jgi:adhesin transport system outer membrane protein
MIYKKLSTIKKSLLAVAILAAVAQSGHTLSLQDAAQATLNNNPQLKAARLEAESRTHEIRLAQSGYYPDLTAIASIGQEDNSNTNGNNTNMTRTNAGLVAEQMLFDGYGTRSEVDRQKARFQSASHTAEQNAEELVLQSSQAYLTVLREQDLYALAKETLENHRSIYDQTELRANSGVGSQADLEQITGRLALANTNLVTTEANLLDAATKFKSVVGISPVVKDMQYPELGIVLPASLDAATSDAEAKNPALLSAAADVEAGKAQYEASKSPFWPRVTLEAEHNYSNNVQGISGDEESTLVALRMKYKLYSGGEDTARKKQTAVLMNEAMEIRNDKQRKVVEALGYYWSAIDAINRQMPYLQKHVDAAGATRDAYNEQYDIGRRTLLDLLNTENELVDARRSLIKAHYDQVLSQLQLLSVMGSLRSSLALTDSEKVSANAQ